MGLRCIYLPFFTPLLSNSSAAIKWWQIYCVFTEDRGDTPSQQCFNNYQPVPRRGDRICLYWRWRRLLKSIRYFTRASPLSPGYQMRIIRWEVSESQSSDKLISPPPHSPGPTDNKHRLRHITPTPPIGWGWGASTNQRPREEGGVVCERKPLLCWKCWEVGSQLWEMQQSERVSSTTSGVEGAEAPGEGEEESDLDSWPEDTTSPHDSNDLITTSHHLWPLPHSSPLDFYSESEYDDTEATSTTSTSTATTALRESLSCGPCQSCRSPVVVTRYQAFSLGQTNPPTQPFRYTRKLFSNNR